MVHVNTRVAAIWAKCNADIAALKVKAQQEVDALYAEARAARSKVKPEPAAPLPESANWSSPNQYWSFKYNQGLLPADFDWANLPPIPDDDDWQAALKEHYHG